MHEHFMEQLKLTCINKVKSKYCKEFCSKGESVLIRKKAKVKNLRQTPKTLENCWTFWHLWFDTQPIYQDK